MIKKLKKWFRNNYRIIVFSFGILIFIFLLRNIFQDRIVRRDNLIYSYISKYLINDYFTVIFKIITSFAGIKFIIFSTLLLMFIIKNKKLKIAIPLNLFMVTILNLILKNIVQRPRPVDYRIINESGYSFPSGHSMISLAFYGLIIYVIYKKMNNKVLKYVLMILLFILILLIGFSRVYLGVHYASDVVAGYCITTCYLAIFTSILSKVVLNDEKQKINK